MVFFAGVLAVFLAAVFFFGISCTSVLPPSPREACALLATDASRAAIRSTTCALGSGVSDAWGGSLPYRFASMTFSSASV
ncbi:hypothetical protein ABT150_07005 [Streptomyces mirabilis]|uniref:hypothetical protein n=1 Tax=Streptomyces mirabilis TaxID=68239 RepID=UPI0033345C1A